MAPKCPVPKRHGAELSSAESAAPSRRRRNGGAEMALPHNYRLPPETEILGCELFAIKQALLYIKEEYYDKSIRLIV